MILRKQTFLDDLGRIEFECQNDKEIMRKGGAGIRL
jgi:hypothetical protein